MSGGLQVDAAGLPDAPALAALAAACFTRPWSLAQWRDEIALAAPNAVLVARGRVSDEAPPSIHAFCAYRVLLDEMQVLDVAVRPSARRRGLARLLLRLALRAGARAGARLASIEVRESNQAALALYAGLGFSSVGRRRAYYRDPSEDALLLERPFPDHERTFSDRSSV